MFSWDDFVQVLVKSKIELEHLKVIQLAQAILESGRGQSELFRLHGNPFGLKYRREMSQIAVPIQVDASDGPDVYCKFEDLQDAVAGYWIFIDRPVYSGWRANNRTAEDYIRFITFAGYVGGPFNGTPEDRAKKEQYISKVLSLVPEAHQRLGTQPERRDDQPRLWKAKGVLLEVGHGSNPGGFEPGAVRGSVREYDLNWIAARAAKAVIDAAGVPCAITDSGASLYNIGKLAADHDVFCSIHHNSAGNPAQGTEVLVHINKADAADLRLSSLMSAEIARELGIRDRIANGRNPRQALAVLSGAEDTNVRTCVLAELYFMHVPVPDSTDWSTRGGEAIGRAILQWLRETA
jgi:N-acetylmuramoyl-L-alanine amidase